MQHALQVLLGHRLAVLHFVYSFHDLQRVVFEVFDALVEFALGGCKLLELPVAHAKQDAIEEDNLTEPVNSGVEGLLVRDARVLSFAISLLIILFACVLQEGLYSMRAVAQRSKSLESYWMCLRILEMANEDVVDRAQRSPHDDDTKSDDRNGHFYRLNF